MSIPDLYKINDTRILTKFSKYTFCDFQKTIADAERAAK